MTHKTLDPDNPELKKPDPIHKAPLTKMDPTLKALVSNMSPFQRTYLQMRSRGMSQADAAKRAGSQAGDQQSLGRVGYNVEQIKGAKDYMVYLQEQRTRISMVDEVEVIGNIRKVFEEAMTLGKMTDALKAAELLGNSIGMFGKTGSSATLQERKSEKEIKEASEQLDKKLEAFKEENIESGNQTDEKYKQLQKLLRDLNKAKI